VIFVIIMITMMTLPEEILEPWLLCLTTKQAQIIKIIEIT